MHPLYVETVVLVDHQTEEIQNNCIYNRQPTYDTGQPPAATSLVFRAAVTSGPKRKSSFFPSFVQIKGGYYLGSGLLLTPSTLPLLRPKNEASICESIFNLMKIQIKLFYILFKKSCLSKMTFHLMRLSRPRATAPGALSQTTCKCLQPKCRFGPEVHHTMDLAFTRGMRDCRSQE